MRRPTTTPTRSRASSRGFSHCVRGASTAYSETLHGEHAALTDGWSRLRLPLSEIAAGAGAVLSAAEVVAVTAVYAAHISREDDLLIPLARRTLDPAALTAIGREMADRRGVSFEPELKR